MFHKIFLLAVCIIGLHAAVLKKAEDVESYKHFLMNTVHGKPTDPANSDLIELQNEWERSGKFEGDIVLSDKQIETLVSLYLGERNALNSQNVGLWPNKTVYYKIDTSYFDDDQIKAIEDAVAEINSVSCLDVLPRTEGIYINVQGKDEGCFATIGYNGIIQDLNLALNRPGSGCFSHGTIIHEFLHSIGFFHMQSTYTRDDYVKIIWEKIQHGTESNFLKLPSLLVNNLGQDYDYGSVMHYSEYGFSIDGNKTIVAIKPTNETIGQRIGMSENDIIKLNKLYKCPGF